MKKKKPVFEGKMRLKKGDEVIVLAGNDRLDSEGKPKHGKILRTVPEQGQVVVEDVNVVKRHKKSRSSSQKAVIKSQLGEMLIPMPLPVSKVMLVCPKCGKPTRISAVKAEDGAHIRKCRKCGQLVD